MRTYPFQIWFNVIENDVEQVEMIGANDRAEAFEIINALLTNGVEVVTLRDNWGSWTRHKLGGANG